MNCKYNNTSLNIAVCADRCRTAVNNCPLYNRNIALCKPILEQPCDKSEREYHSGDSIIKCSAADCPNIDNCSLILSPEIITSDNYLRYSEFSGYGSVISPNYITIDLQRPEAVQTIQFLLWDNRGNDKSEACNREHRYRLLVSDYEGDLVYDSAVGDVLPRKTEESVSWRVLYDSLRTGYNGWQVFNLDKPLTVRYLKLHMLSNSDGKVCNLVRIEAYSTQLVGYRHNFLPTFEALVNTSEQASATVGVKRNIEQNSINRFTKELLRRIEKKVEDNRNDGSLGIANEIELFKNDLQSVIEELEIYENRVNEVKDRIFKGTNLILDRAKVIKYVSVAIGIIGLILNFI